MRRVTIRDVAAEAGVSIGTASKALNGQGKLRAETRERVAEAAQQLGFAPNTLAQALLAGRSFTVGLITTDSFGRFSIPVMLGAEDALGTGQVSVFMCDTRDDPDRERRYIEMLSARRVDGLIVTGRRVEPRPPVTAGPGIPVVYAMTQPLGQGGPAVLPDDEGGGRAAAEHLLAAGRRRIGHITGPERVSWPPASGPPGSRPRWRRRAWSRTAACGPASGASAGAGSRLACCSPTGLTSTRSSAVAIRSRAASGTRCARRGGGSRTTWRWSGSTTGSRWRSAHSRR
jgi:transcriptional regulator with XRE-family HTH domain